MYYEYRPTSNERVELYLAQVAWWLYLVNTEQGKRSLLFKDFIFEWGPDKSQPLSVMMMNAKAILAYNGALPEESNGNDKQDSNESRSQHDEL